MNTRVNSHVDHGNTDMKFFKRSWFYFHNSITSRHFIKMIRYILLLVPIAGVMGKGRYYSRLPAMEYEHAASMYTSPRTRIINGTDVLVEDPKYTPDFRIEEPPFIRHRHGFAEEEERPYRISPAYKQLDRWYSRDNPKMLGCACTTVFKRTHLLATCAVLTTKHILTTATSTELILKNRRQLNRLTNILGVWYDVSNNDFNSSHYNTPVRIHYHPRYVFPKNVNRSHPVPVVYDLSVWTMMFNFRSGLFSGAYICDRGGSHWLSYGSSVPRANELAITAGFQFIRAFKRKPMPWFKYAVRTRKHVQPCPKVEWGWFHCLKGTWAKLGLDSGAPMYRALEGKTWRYDGLIGMNAVSMVLRSYDMIHYFTVLDVHPVLDFLYAAYTNKIKKEYLDKRFQDTTNRSPVTTEFKITVLHDVGFQHYYKKDLPNYK